MIHNQVIFFEECCESTSVFLIRSIIRFLFTHATTVSFCTCWDWILDCQEKLDMDVRLADGIDSNFDGADNT